VSIERSDGKTGVIARLRKRGVVRVAASYAVITWLALQIADVVLDPLGAPAWAMRAAIVVAMLGFPVAVLLAWFYELGPDGIHRDTAPESSPRPSARGIGRFADLVIIAVLLIVIGILIARGPGEYRPGNGESPVVAVLPFTEIGAEEDGFFGMGLADTLIHKLGQLPQLVVLTSNSTFQFRGPGLDLAAVCAQLGASALVEGTVQRAAGRFRINARLVEAKSGRQIWSDQYDRKSGDVFAVQDEIATAVSSALSVVLSPGDEKRLAQPLTNSLTAFDAYTLGQLNLAKRSLFVHDAIGFFQRAIELDPDYALAQAALAEALYMAPYYLRDDIDWEDVADEARAAAAAARELNPELAEAWLAQFYVAEAENRWSGEQIWLDEQLHSWLKRAIELNPSSAAATRYLARYAESPEEKIRLLERAALLDPRSGIIAYDVAVEYSQLRDFDRATEWLLKSGNTAEPFFRIGYSNIPIVYAFDAGALDEAARWAHLFSLAFPGEFDSLHFESLWDLGLMSEAADVLEKIRNRAAESGDPDLSAYVHFNDFINAWRNGDSESADSIFDQIARESLSELEEWPDLSRYPGADWLMALHAVSLVRAGEHAHALEAYQAAIPQPLEYDANVNSSIFFQPALMTAALMKLNGQHGEARRLILQFIEHRQASPVGGRPGVGHARFMAQALLGDVESARAAMQEVLDANFTAMTWQLEVAGFDADYRAVMADPSVEAMYQELLARIAVMRESYLQQPELPPEIMPARFKSL